MQKVGAGQFGSGAALQRNKEIPPEETIETGTGSTCIHHKKATTPDGCSQPPVLHDQEALILDTFSQERHTICAARHNTPNYNKDSTKHTRKRPLLYCLLSPILWGTRLLPHFFLGSAFLALPTYPLLLAPILCFCWKDFFGTPSPEPPLGGRESSRHKSCLQLLISPRSCIHCWVWYPVSYSGCIVHGLASSVERENR